MSVAETFTEVADYTARASGRPIVFGLVAASTAVWLLAGPVFAFSDGLCDPEFSKPGYSCYSSEAR